MEYTAIIEKTESGMYVAQCEQIPQAITQGKTIDEVKENLIDAINLCLEYNKEETIKQHKGLKYIRRKIAVV
jgi:predicted RNase H-like HicB family nuclease